MTKKNIISSFDGLISRINNEIISYRMEAASSLQIGNDIKHDEIYERMKIAILIVKKLEDLKREWEEMIGFVLSSSDDEDLPDIFKTPVSAISQHTESPSMHRERNPLPRNLSTTDSIRVTFPDGYAIQEKTIAETLVKVIERLGVNRVYNLHLDLKSGDKYPMVDLYPIKGQGPYCVGKYYVHTQSSTEEKIKRIYEMRAKLNVDLTVDAFSNKD